MNHMAAVIDQELLLETTGCIQAICETKVTSTSDQSTVSSLWFFVLVSF